MKFKLYVDSGHVYEIEAKDLPEAAAEVHRREDALGTRPERRIDGLSYFSEKWQQWISADEMIGREA